MAYRIAQNVLNASTIDILNVIRANASLNYQNLVPEVATKHDVVKVGEKIYGTPALANEFLNALVNRIALVRIQSATFNNPYADLKKGYIEYGESIEEIFVNIAKVRAFDVEKVEAREFKRTLPDVRSTFHVINWRVQYPVTIEDEELRKAFLTLEGVQDLIARIVDQVYAAAEYDEFLLFKYKLIKAIAHGQMAPQAIDTTADFDENAIAFRGVSNKMVFPNKLYNEAQVMNNTPKERQHIFMSAEFNARYDVKTLAAAFNMEKADFSGRLRLIDDWGTFDNERFEVIRQESDGLEEVTAAELAIMKDVVAVLIDEEWFQIYDNLEKFTEKYAASGMYWNYFLNVWKTVSNSPFANAVVFIDSATKPEMPATVTVKVISKDTADDGTTAVALGLDPATGITSQTPVFINTETSVTNGIGVEPYGALMIPAAKAATTFTLSLAMGGEVYNAAATAWGSAAVGDTVSFTKAASKSTRTVKTTAKTTTTEDKTEDKTTK